MQRECRAAGGPHQLIASSDGLPAPSYTGALPHSQDRETGHMRLVKIVLVFVLSIAEPERT